MRYIYFLLLFNVSIIFSQQSVVPPQVMSPSPTPSSLAKFVDQPVSLYTGIPSIQIPLWEIKLNGFALPIELKYHSGGIKVQETASNVGLGWALNAGGVITRAVKGKSPDDYGKSGKFHDENSEYPKIGRFWTGKYDVLKNIDLESPDDTYVENQFGQIIRNHPALTYSFAGDNDAEPDIFYYSFGNKSGKFVFDINGNSQSIELIPYEDIRISHTLNNNGEIIAFTITDEDGTQYFFEEVERIKEGQYSDDEVSGLQMTSSEYNSSWYLSKIKTKNKQEVSFEYVNEQLYLWQQTGQANTKVWSSPLPDFEGMGTHGFVMNASWSYSITESSSVKRISKIITSNEIIEFNAVTRSDVSTLTGLTNPQKAISSIVINNKFSQLIKRYELGLDYFVSSQTGVVTPDPSDFYRLKLSYVNEYYASLKNKTYSFGYNNIALPNKRSPRQDFWGYFNNNQEREYSNLGAGSPTRMIPQIYVYPSLKGNYKYQLNPLCYPYNFTDNYIEPGANRNANPDFAQAAILTSVIYPTGGRAEYTYESNEFLYGGCLQTGGGLRVSNIKTFEKRNSTTPLTSKNYSYLGVDGKSSGVVTAMPIFNNILTKSILKHVSSISQSKLGTTNGSHVGYKRVIEYVSGLGKTIYEYSAPGMIEDNADTEYGLYKPTTIRWLGLPFKSGDGNISFYENLKSYYVQNHLFPNNFPFPQNPDYDWNRGKLKKESVFDEFGNLEKEKKYNYIIYTKTNRPNKVFGLNYSMLASNFLSGYLEYHIALLSKYHYITNRANVLESVETKDYDSPNTFVTTIDNYRYTSNFHKKIMQNINYDSSNKEFKTEYQYTSDMLLPSHLADQQKPYVRELYDLNYIVPIITKKFVADQKISEEEVVYNQFNSGLYLPSAVYLTKGLENINILNKNDRKIEFIKYDTNGNIQEYKLENGIPVSVIWGYNKSQPIAKIENATYLQIAIALGKTTGVVNNYNETNLSIINSLRSYLPYAMVTTYTYKPLIGITSITDPRGDTVTYTYDDFGRLQFVKDKNDQILSENQYNYKQ